MTNHEEWDRARRQELMVGAIFSAIALTRTVATREPSHCASRPYGRVSSYRKEGNDNGRG